MRRETLPELHEPWMKKLKIAPLALDDELFDFSQGFRSRLYESLLNGWLEDHSMIVATSDDPRLDGQVVQGKHRCITISQILKDGHKFDISKILIRRVEVNSVDQLRALRAAYEVSASLTKDPKLSKKWIAANLSPIIKNKSQEGHNKILGYLRDLGFNNDTIATKLIEDVLDQLDRKRKKAAATTTRQQSQQQPRIPEHVLNQSWRGPHPIPETIDNATSYIREVAFKCEHCGKDNRQPINIACSDRGELVKVAVAR